MIRAQYKGLGMRLKLGSRLISGILPLRYEGVPLMSMGFLRPKEHAAIRGPMASAMVTQMLTTTEWGELDVLLLDLPPGTGDIHLTVAQQAT